MAHHNDGVNPLRPYYIPPSIGEPPEVLPTPGPRAFAQANSTGRYASKARDIFSDIDYKNYEPSPSVVQTVKEVLDELLWKYTSVLMAQPFEVAKTIMQVRAQDDLGGLEAIAEAAGEARQRQASQRINMYDEGSHSHSDSDSDLDESAFFTSHQPRTPSPTLSRSKNPRRPTSESPRPSAKPVAAHQLAIRTPDSVLEVIAQLWHKEGAWGVWKGSNATFIYSVLQSLLENWSRSLLSALFNVPDLGLKNDMDRLVDIASPYPWASLCVAAAAAVVTGLILSPLDLVRTRLVITSTASRASRRTLSTLRSLPSYLCPSPLVVPTVLHALVHPLLTLSTPLVLRSHFMIDRELAPTTFSIAKFCSSTVALLLKLPLETVLRRGQVAVLASPAYVQQAASLQLQQQLQQQQGGRRLEEKSTTTGVVVAGGEMDTVVPVGRYAGVFGTMYAIVNEEGSRAVGGGAAAAAASRAAGRKGKGGPTTVAETVYRRGQGLDGLWRGWKVSWWGLVGLWAAGVLGGGGDGEF
ncbi:mitochondrial fusion and transport protein ugo1 [Chaetomidium leptoderma]|uniref:Mitochondrial fusion and transport protein ugo1 n=1 Tax=Chaetomidium leptoderma TaxID=669021 RepID=A0AAN6ZVJ0_9PEZI|nr:mitochondrial fusion and transport protein ugo1 [Chaetomidium leptoderma]